MRPDRYREGFEVGLKGWHIEDDWYVTGLPYPSDYVRGWDAGAVIWRRAHSYWGA